MVFETLKWEEESGVGLLTINRPQALNALNQQVIQELEELVAQWQEKPLRALIITGEGKAFVAGADISAFKEMRADQAVSLAERGQKLMSNIEQLSFPVIAAVNGFALGGGMELALACDFIVASEKAKLGLPEVGLGLIPGYGGTQRLSRVAGKAVAKAITMSGHMFTANEFYNWGIVIEVAPADDLIPKAKEWVTRLVSKAPLAIAKVKKLIDEGFDKSLEEALCQEAQLFGECFSTQDKSEGVSAFLEKRTPQFKGN